MKKLIYLFIICSILSTVSFSQNGTSHSPELVVHLLDYLAKDYGGAVQGGKVIRQSEYSEQVEFADIVYKNSQGVSQLSSNNEFMAEVQLLKTLIKNKGDAVEVAAKARALQQAAIQLANIDVAPKSAPDLEAGAKIYQNSCVACHGHMVRV